MISSNNLGLHINDDHEIPMFPESRFAIVEQDDLYDSLKSPKQLDSVSTELNTAELSENTYHSLNIVYKYTAPADMFPDKISNLSNFSLESVPIYVFNRLLRNCKISTLILKNLEDIQICNCCEFIIPSLL